MSLLLKTLLSILKKEKAFTPKQLSLLIWRLKKADIDFNKSHFKLTIKKKREQENLLQLEDWKLKSIWECLSSSQKKFVMEKKGLSRAPF